MPYFHRYVVDDETEFPSLTIASECLSPTSFDKEDCDPLTVDLLKAKTMHSELEIHSEIDELIHLVHDLKECGLDCFLVFTPYVDS